MKEKYYLCWVFRL